MANDGDLSRLDEARYIDLGDPEEVAYWCQKFGVAEDLLRYVVDQVGHWPRAVDRKLRGIYD